MSTWNFDEIEICQRKLFPQISTDIVRELYMKWGGILLDNFFVNPTQRVNWALSKLLLVQFVRVVASFMS